MSFLPFPVHKLNGAGNIFLFIDSRPGSPFRSWEEERRIDRAEMAKSLCSFERLAADGLIFLENKDGEPEGFIWDFYNADGSGAEMCGNAARCAGAFAREALGFSPPLSLATRAGSVRIRLEDDGRWSVEMPPVQDPPRALSLEVDGVSYEGHFVNSGVPHFVLPTQPGREPGFPVCRALRGHPDLGPAGANVTLLDGEKARTFERGVENFTAACGTGAVAAALVRSRGRAGLYTVRMPGGDLQVRLGGDGPVLTGPAFLTAKIEISQETFA